MPRKLTNWSLLWDNYPEDHNADRVKEKIGGKVNYGWITNTCTIRLSRALNYAKQPIPSNFSGLNVVSGGDHKWYAYRVKEMRKYLEATYGKADIQISGRTDEMRTGVLGKRGIIMFDVRGWSDATGHYDLWDGSRIRYSEYFAKASTVLLWKVMGLYQIKTDSH
jgi:hypothetical protein